MSQAGRERLRADQCCPGLVSGWLQAVDRWQCGLGESSAGLELLGVDSGIVGFYGTVSR
jgi:hypothetical protein